MALSHSQFDKWLDSELRSVRVPERLAQRLKQITVPDDGELDAELRDVAVPKQLHQRLLRIARPRRRAYRQTALAASLFITVGFWFTGVISSLLLATYTPAPAPLLTTVALDLSGDLIDNEGSDVAPIEIEPPDGVSIAIAEHSLREPIEQSFQQQHAAIVAQKVPRGPPALAETTNLDWLLTDVALLGLGDVLADSAIDELPELHKVASPAPRGVDASLDLATKFFLLRYGVFPPVRPAMYPSSQVPLVGDVSSYELTRNYLGDGELPPSNKIRTEEFLAAVDYGFQRPTDRLFNLVFAAGPSPWGVKPAVEQRNFQPREADARSAVQQGSQLLQVGVQMRDVPDGQRRGTHLTIAVDVSGSMRLGNRLSMVKQALQQTIAQMGPLDRVSLVTFSEQACPLIEDAGVAEVAQLRRAVDSLRIGSATNVGAGLLVCCSVAGRGAAEKQAAHRVVVVTDGLAEMDLRAIERVERLLQSPAAARLKLHLIDVSQDAEPDPRLLEIANRVEGTVYHASNADEVRWSLLEVLWGRPQVLAADARLTVSFNPATVASYRLFGHEPTVLTGLLPGPAEVDLHSGQSGTVLYELELLPGREPEVATVRFEWRSPYDGTLRQTSRRITRAHFAASPAESPASLQVSAVAAGTAEVLRNSPFASHFSAADLLKRGRQINTPEGKHPTFLDLLSLLEQIERLDVHRRAPRAGAPN